MKWTKLSEKLPDIGDFVLLKFNRTGAGIPRGFSPWEECEQFLHSVFDFL